MTGTSTAWPTAWTSAGPSARIPTAPPSTAARAMAAMKAGPWSGSPGGAWQDTTRPPCSRRRMASRSTPLTGAPSFSAPSRRRPPCSWRLRQATAGQLGRPDHDGVVAKMGRQQGDARDRREQMPAEVPLGRGPVPAGRVDHAAAHDHRLGVDGVDQPGQQLAQDPTALLDNLDGRPVARLGPPRDLGEADGVAGQQPVAGGHRRSRRDALQMPVGTAGAATIAEPRDREVADLAGVVVRAPP